MLRPTHPNLPFGNQDALVDHSLQSVSEKIGKAVAGDFDVGLVGKNSKFLHAANQLSFGQLHLNALGFSPIRIHRKTETKRTIIIPFSGELEAVVDGKVFVARAGHTGLFSSGKPRAGTMNNNLSQILVELDDLYLLQVASAMRGADQPCAARALRLDQDRELPLHINGISFESVFRTHCRTVDSLRQQPEALAMLGLDDAIYRSFVALLAPTLVFGNVGRDADRRAKEANTLNRVCDYIQYRLSHPLTMTELEQVSGLSERGLQYAFQRRFGCSPFAWVRLQRLAMAQALLRDANSAATVNGVALQAGFATPSLFARHYRKHFGELPSETLLQTHRH